MQSVLHLDDRTVAELVDPAAAQRAVDDAFAAWGRGEAATTQRVRASAGGGMASAMAAVVPPYCGGKLYATNAGRFTFLNALFHTDGRLLATLDGDAVTLLRTAAASSLAIRHLAAPHASVAAVIGTGHQAAATSRCCCGRSPDWTNFASADANGPPPTSSRAMQPTSEAHVTVHTDPMKPSLGPTLSSR